MISIKASQLTSLLASVFVGCWVWLSTFSESLAPPFTEHYISDPILHHICGKCQQVFFLFYSFVTCNADCESSWLWQVNACAIMRMTCIFFFFLACELTGKLSGALGSSVQNAWAILPWGDSASVTLNSPSQNRLLVFARILMVPCPLSLWSLRWKEGLWF